MSDAEIKAVHRKDLEDVVTRLGLTDSLNRGLLVCDVCGTPVNWDNIGTIFKKEGTVRVCCNRQECIEKVYAELRVRDASNSSS